MFANHRLTVALLDRIMRAGIPAVEIFCARQHLDYRNRAQITELGHWFQDSELKVHAVHAPMHTDEIWGRSGPHALLTITETSKGKRNAMVDEIKRVLEIAEYVPFQYLVQHIGMNEEMYDDRKVEAAFTALDELMLFARQRGVEILIENIPNALSSADGLRRFEDMTHLKLHYVFDVGHAHIGEGVGPTFDLMKERIRSTHIHDNDGKTDQHLFPFAEGGTVNWPETMTLLRSRHDQYPLLLELREVPGMTNPLDKVREIFDRLEEIEAEE